MVRNGLGMTAGVSIVRKGGAVVTCRPKVDPTRAPKKVLVRDSIWARRGRGVHCFNGCEGEVAVPKDTPGTRGTGLTEVSDHPPELLQVRLWAARVPRHIEGNDAKDKTVSSGSGDDDVQGYKTTEKAVRDRYALAVKVMMSGQMSTLWGSRTCCSPAPAPEKPPGKQSWFH